MPWFDAIVLGIVQGLTEFLPISSSAHQSIVGQLIGDRDPGAAFTAINQLGTELAVLIFFWRDIVRIIKHWALSIFGKLPKSDPDAKMGWYIIIGSLPIIILGLLFQNMIKTHFRNLWVTATMLLVFGIILGVVDRIAKNEKTLEDLTAKRGILFGLAQSLALIPGVSRSGGTIAAGLLMGYKREAAARYSFLLAIPAVIGSGVLEVVDVASGPKPDWPPIIIATIIAFIVGYATIAWLLKYISSHSFTIFVYYRIALALVVFALLGTGVLHA